MSKLKHVIWSPEIVEDVKIVLEYLDAEWPEKVGNEFKEKLFTKIEAIRTGFSGGKLAYNMPGVRSVSITKHNRLYFESDENAVYLLRLIDTRRDPTQNPFE